MNTFRSNTFFLFLRHFAPLLCSFSIFGLSLLSGSPNAAKWYTSFRSERQWCDHLSS